MKKIIFLLSTAVLLLACKKDYSCTCAYEDGSTEKSTATNVSEANAVEECLNNAPTKIDPRTGYQDCNCVVDK